MIDLMTSMLLFALIFLFFTPWGDIRGSVRKTVLFEMLPRTTTTNITTSSTATTETTTLISIIVTTSIRTNTKIDYYFRESFAKDTESLNPFMKSSTADIIDSIYSAIQDFVDRAIKSTDLRSVFERIFPPVSISFNQVTVLPPPFHNLINPCPDCVVLDRLSLPGHWHLVYASDHFLHRRLSILKDIAEFGSTNGRISYYSRLRFPRTLLCVRFQVMEATQVGVEIDFPLQLTFSDGNSQYSLIGRVIDGVHGKYSIVFNEDKQHEFRLCSSYTNIAASKDSLFRIFDKNSSISQTIVLTDLGGFPGCSDYMVLTKNRTDFFLNLDTIVRNYLKRRRVDTDINPIRYVGCPFN